MGVGGQRQSLAALPPPQKEIRYTLYVQEAGWAAGPVWMGTENLASTGIRSPDRPARTQSQ
jgi:hypothetical protein